jgi:hypothetical protein
MEPLAQSFDAVSPWTCNVDQCTARRTTVRKQCSDNNRARTVIEALHYTSDRPAIYAVGIDPVHQRDLCGEDYVEEKQDMHVMMNQDSVVTIPLLIAYRTSPAVS